MGIRVRHNDIKKAFEDAIKKVEAVTIGNLQYVGELAVNAARGNTQPKKNPDGTAGGGTSYLDDTGNLRSSIGYIIMKNGEVVDDSKFPQTKASATEGTETGYSLAEKIASQYPNKYVLIIVAGMNYATYVEKKEYDVITFVESEARAAAKRIFSELKI